MAQKTTNYNLHKIDLTDAPPDITKLNPNFDTIDKELKRLGDESLSSVPQYVDDANIPAVKGVHVDYFKATTNNTPYAHGLTQFAEGYLLTSFNGGANSSGQQTAYCSGLDTPFVRSFRKGVWGEWKNASSNEHNHDDRYYTESEIDDKCFMKRGYISGNLTGTLNGSYLTDTSGVTNLPSGWVQGRHTLANLSVGNEASYDLQLLGGYHEKAIAFRMGSNGAWKELATTESDVVTIPNNTDLATYLPTMKENKIYRQNPNSGVKNSPNPALFCFYTRQGSVINCTGYDRVNPSYYITNVVNGEYFGWRQIATTSSAMNYVDGASNLDANTLTHVTVNAPTIYRGTFKMSSLPRGVGDGQGLLIVYPYAGGGSDHWNRQEFMSAHDMGTVWQRFAANGGYGPWKRMSGGDYVGKQLIHVPNFTFSSTNSVFQYIDSRGGMLRLLITYSPHNLGSSSLSSTLTVDDVAIARDTHIGSLFQNISRDGTYYTYELIVPFERYASLYVALGGNNTLGISAKAYINK